MPTGWCCAPAGGVEVSVPIDRIVRIRVAEGRFVNGAYWPHDPNDSRLFFGPTGRTLDAGDGYVAMYQLFFPFVGYGATDWLTLAGGTPIFPGIIGEAFYLAPKARVVNAPQAEVSVGVMAVFLTRELDQGSAGLVYGTGTFGSRDSAITGGAALHFFTGGDDPLLGNDPVLMLGGEHRVGRSIKLISENYLIPDGGRGRALRRGALLRRAALRRWRPRGGLRQRGRRVLPAGPQLRLQLRRRPVSRLPGAPARG
jgi:hypothetical protein